MQNVREVTELEYPFLFTLRKVNSIKLEGFKPFFNDMPVDPYIKGNYRYRRISRFSVTGDQLIKLPHGYLIQSKKYNPLVGDIKREFAELDDAMIELEIFKNLVFAFTDSCKLHPQAEIGVHQIRTSCSLDNSGNPAPEGIHRDGVDFLGIFSVDRDNILGGETHLYTSKEKKPIFSQVLNPGELLLVNDHEFSHFTTPIKSEIDAQGTRDVFVLTSPSLVFD
ncbi:MAG: 2OG-Fe dioxygenase family protein [Stigonema ocellatum SAG 48.90 = DSM 106950]|nr:2OG-Fe dioxygenase family protein [Stigonema ocellatum SAG 48.90 = DSM 106950]